MEKALFIEGTWQGKGTMLPKSVPYLETATFTVIKTEPAIVVEWLQRTKHAEKGFGLHAENGFLKVLPAKNDDGSNKGELMLSHPFSMNEMYTQVSFNWDENTLTCIADKPECF